MCVYKTNIICDHFYFKVIIVDDKPFIFDTVLGPAVSQEQLYHSLIQPLIEKMLNGFHCTVLAYGQTGTGKSYTMGLQSDVSYC